MLVEGEKQAACKLRSKLTNISPQPDVIKPPFRERFIQSFPTMFSLVFWMLSSQLKLSYLKLSKLCLWLYFSLHLGCASCPCYVSSSQPSTLLVSQKFSQICSLWSVIHTLMRRGPPLWPCILVVCGYIWSHLLGTKPLRRMRSVPALSLHPS